MHVKILPWTQVMYCAALQTSSYPCKTHFAGYFLKLREETIAAAPIHFVPKSTPRQCCFTKVQS